MNGYFIVGVASNVAGYVSCACGLNPIEAVGIYLGVSAILYAVNYWLANIEAFSARRHRRRKRRQPPPGGLYG